MDVRLVLAVALLFIVTVTAQGNVEFWRTTVTLTCPKEGTWTLDEKDKSDIEEKTKEYQYEIKRNPLSYCEYNDDSENPVNPEPKIKYFFYVKGKVCENCFELEGTLFLLIIIVDVIGTAIVMIAIYKCAKKKAPSGPARPKATSRSGPAPPTPSRDYEQLNPHTRSLETYSVVNRTG
ncbi:T-cell surface glycoprotein CD3 epsilon chain-like [Betta splendens]|uniref:T-cell surface glycoprotein CD3 epsilon chain-like n=1 Tax=Betta splendens TaxID=158456 RepID=A0A6P7PHH7_BETSP|nr:T-cell surface glycoprotein CD3 epsilon chain-like [Betta splendens]